MKWIRRILGIFLVVVAIATVCIYALAHRQGSLSADYDVLKPVRVVWDAEGVPTIEGPDWKQVIEAQGFVVASERMFQMDLMRRSAYGGLSEWFGSHPSAIEWDRGRRLEDWKGIAEKAVAKMDKQEKEWCDAYAAGVNKFILSSHFHFGIEYLVLNGSPDLWECSDSVLILMSLVDDLSRAVEREAWTTVWHENLSPDWFDFLFPDAHPWNKPMFGVDKKGIRPPTKRLPLANIDEKALSDALPTDAFTPGSNSWYWAGKTGAFLANDPHLGMTVPQIWFANRLRVSSEDWIVGAAAPGMPGVILGRNPSLSWAFTNAYEDVDDLLEEELSEDGKSYVASVTNGKKNYQPLREQHYSFAVRGDKAVSGIARFTHRGPLLQFAELGKDRYFSRQWLGFVPDRLTVPYATLNRAKSAEEMLKSLDRFGAPAQSVVFTDNAGNATYRMSGTGVKKKVKSVYAVSALDGEWRGFAPASERKQMRIARDKAGQKPVWLGTANQRIYVDPLSHHWSGDVREDRINEVLRSSDAHTLGTMWALQHDTRSRYLKLFTDWLIRNNSTRDANITRIEERWKAWDGFAKNDPLAFTLAVEAHRHFTRVLMTQVRTLLPKEARATVYAWKNSNAWMVYLLEHEGTLDAFGLNPQAIAHFAVKKAAEPAAAQKTYNDLNRWRAQHPMAGAVPLLGSWLKVDEHPQWGFEGLVRVEREKSGASLRVIWNLDKPLESVWNFPVGQSGHVASDHYEDFRKLWFEEKTARVFADGFEWKFTK